MSNDTHAKSTEGRRMLLTAGLLAALVVGCSKADSVEVTAGPAPVEAEAGSTFQGAVASLHPADRELVVAVRMVWAPSFQTERHDRRVLVGDADVDLSSLRVGDEVQVKATGMEDGRWRAVEVMVLDVD